MTMYIRGDYHVCPNPLSFDPYTVCQYNCAYCFVKQMEKTVLKRRTEQGIKSADLDKLNRILSRAFDNRKESSNSIVNMLRAGMPVLIGRKCEPFCDLEKKEKTTKKAIDLFHRYGVKNLVETKLTTDVSIFDKMDGLMISIMPGIQRKSFHDLMEPGTSSFDERLEFAKSAKEAGLFVGIVGGPILPGVNTNKEDIEALAHFSSECNADHVNFEELRVHKKGDAIKRFNAVGLNLNKIMIEHDKNWIKYGNMIFDILESYNLKVSTPDWINFMDRNACEGCCGLDDFGIHKFTFQHAVKKIKGKKKAVVFKDIAKHNLMGEKAINRVKSIWNSPAKGKYFNLTDINKTIIYGKDSEGNHKFKRSRDLSEFC